MLVPAARAQWGSTGAIVSGADGNQRSPKVVTDQAGGAFIIFDQYTSLHMQRLDVLGVRLFGDDGMDICTASGSLPYANQLVADGYSGALVAWKDERVAGTHAYIQRVNSGGYLRWAADGLWVADYVTRPRILPDGAGGVFVGWERTVGSHDIAIQRLDLAGTPQWSGDYVDVGMGSMVGLLPDGAGGLLVGWQSTIDVVVGERLDGDGALLWGGSLLNHWTAPACVFDGVMAPDGEGGAYWIWDQGSDLYAQRLDADGALVFSEYGIYVDSFSGASSEARMVTDGAGGALILYTDTGAELYLTHLPSDGSSSWTVSITNLAPWQQNGVLAPDGYGGAFVAWEDYRNSGSNGIDVYAQHFDRDGVAQWAANGVPIGDQPQDQVEVEIAPTGNHGAIIAWEDERISDLYVDIWAQIVHADGSIGDPPFEIYDTTPDPNALDVYAGTDIRVVFSQDYASFTEVAGNFHVDGSFTGRYSGSTSEPRPLSVTRNPSSDFAPGEVVTVTLTDAIQSTGGKSLIPVSWSFTVAAEGVHGGFLGSTEYDVQDYPWGLCPADVNDDGDMDLLVTNYQAASVSYLEGLGNGSFLPAVNFSVGAQARSVCVGDFNDDRYVDAAVACSVSDDVYLLINDQAGGFVAATTAVVGLGPEAVCVADFDGDGSLDIGTACTGSDAVGISLNDGTGKFAAADLYPGESNPFDMVARDLDGDGFPDVATVNSATSNLSIFLNDGTGGLLARTDLATGATPMSIEAADLDADGDLDLVVGAIGTSQVQVFFNLGLADFAAPVNYAAGNGFVGPPSDLNGDGHLDLIYTLRGDDEVAVRHNDGSGGFGAESAFGVGRGPIGVVAADFGGDGALELATSNGISQDASLLTNDFVLSGVEVPEAPAMTRLGPAVPNPFNPSTRIDYALHRASHVRLTVYDLRGREIAVLVDEHLPAQEHSATWEGRDTAGNRVASGVYFYKLDAGEFTETRKMVLVK